jgi:long-chain acyl-CoA synthetase
VATLRFTPTDRVLGVAPFSHVNGLMRSMVGSVFAGATLVPLSQFDRREVGQVIEEQGITVFIGVPFMFAMLAETRWPRPVDFSSLRVCISSSAPLRRETSERFYEKYGRYVRQLYGTTETGTIAVNVSQQAEEALDCVGTPIEGVEVEIFSGDRRVLVRGEVGEIGIRSPAATREYPGMSDQTEVAFWNGYFFPGDIGRKDTMGRVYLLGRKSLFINRGGYKVNPYEIEEVLERHPKVRDVAVVGVDTVYGDQKIKAVVVPSAGCTEDEIIEFCRRTIADFKVPSIVEFRAELPKSSAGKILRRAL